MDGDRPDEPERVGVSVQIGLRPRSVNRSVKRVAKTFLAAIALMVTVTAALPAWPTGSPAGAAVGARSASASSGPFASRVLGVLGVTGRYLGTEHASGIGAVTITVGWADAELTPGTFRASYFQQIRDRIAAARAAGLQVILEPGLQFPPAWVFALSGGTRFVDQYGDAFSGDPPSGNNVANAVTNLAVRSAEGQYLAWLATQIDPGSVIAVREGGGPLGELHYPGPGYAGHTNCYWAYDSSTQSQLPTSVQAWQPGTGSVADATTFLDAYNTGLRDYGTWLNGQLWADFSVPVLVMLPGWGERPGGAAKETASLLTLSMPEFNEGLDWVDLLPALPAGSHSVAYTTYLDGVTYLPTLQLEDPADFIATLVVGTQLTLGGENTGNGTMADMRLSFKRAAALGYVIVDWMSEAQLVASTRGLDPAGPTFHLLSGGAAAWLASA